VQQLITYLDVAVMLIDDMASMLSVPVISSSIKHLEADLHAMC
jgi:hypothetical protein